MLKILHTIYNYFSHSFFSIAALNTLKVYFSPVSEYKSPVTANSPKEIL